MPNKSVPSITPVNRSAWRLILLLVGLLAGGVLLISVSLVQAAPAGQVPIYTPTPLPDGYLAPSTRIRQVKSLKRMMREASYAVRSEAKRHGVSAW